ncbi:MAG: DEAD/DEAH box helicase [Candidatus Ancillula sp.]|nr:DEAD/DEAH box helicase [Candidatus Ancillula sp.]
MKKFEEFGIKSETVESLKEVGIEYPFEIQELSLPIALEGRDIIGQAKTGTGKTYAFSIPLLDKIAGGNKIPRALIILPTRELAIQVTTELKIASSKRTDKISIATVYGGVKIESQFTALRNGVDIVVGTPGRIVDLIDRSKLNLSEVEYLVLDEADRMLDFGFIDSIERIISNIPVQRQMLLFSATLSGGVLQLAKKYTKNAVRISTLTDNEGGETVEHIDNFVYLTHRLDKPELLSRMLQSTPREKSIVFTKMKMRAESLSKNLKQRGFNAYLIHGGLDQAKRERILKKFKESSVDVSAPKQAVLVASDVMARGIDIDNISHVYNYECPDDEAAFLHRTGRTGRAGTLGISVTFVDWEDVVRWRSIAKELNMSDTQPQETYSSSDTYQAELGVPDNATGFVNGVSKESAGKLDTGQRSRSSNGGARRGNPSSRSNSNEHGRRNTSSDSKRKRSNNKNGSGDPKKQVPAGSKSRADGSKKYSKKRTWTAKPRTKSRSSKDGGGGN